MSNPQDSEASTSPAQGATSPASKLADLAEILDSVPAGILILDTDVRIVAANKTASQIAGLGPSPATPSGEPPVSIYDLSKIRHLDGTPYQPDEVAPQRALQGEEILGEQFSLSQLPNGPRRVLLANTVPLHDQAGNIEGIVAVLQDITLLKSFEQERQELLSGAAHDVQNLVTGIIGISQMLKLQIADSNARDWQTTGEALDTIVNSARRLSNQVDILADIARNPADRPFTLQRSPVNLIELVTRIAEEYRPTTQHTIQIVATDAEMSGMFDEHSLQSAIANLIGNAIKFSPRGGAITITVERLISDGSNQASIAVRDTGLGIPASELANVFERHYRASNIAGSIPGTGLGLTGVQRTVTMHGGTVAIESTEGAGTTVTIRLPIIPVPSA